jgi:hypothetical protein
MTETTQPAELDRWALAVAEALDIDAGVLDVALVLDLARHAAHGVARPAAPLTTFLVGYALAQRGGDLAELASTVAGLAADWQPADT